jgi:hypothetical protein
MRSIIVPLAATAALALPSAALARPAGPIGAAQAARVAHAEALADLPGHSSASAVPGARASADDSSALAIVAVAGGMLLAGGVGVAAARTRPRRVVRMG